jgi:hypothetical protein
MGSRGFLKITSRVDEDYKGEGERLKMNMGDIRKIFLSQNNGSQSRRLPGGGRGEMGLSYP